MCEGRKFKDDFKVEKTVQCKSVGQEGDGFSLVIWFCVRYYETKGQYVFS